MPPKRRKFRHFDGWAAQSGRPVISFRGGLKYVDGAGQASVNGVSVFMPTGIREVRSSSGPTIYTSIMWSDGKASCNCPGWATSKQYDAYGQPKDKTCSHSRQVRAGDNVRIINGESVTIAAAVPDRVEAATPPRKIIL